MTIVQLQGENGIVYKFDSDANILGEGGMGRVYLGEQYDQNGIVTPVAIKVLFEGVPEQVIERARREAAIRLSHENLVYMYDFIETDEIDKFGSRIRHYYVISEYLEGVCLADLISGEIENCISKIDSNIVSFYNQYVANKQQKSTEIVKKVLSAVLALHDIGYIHRDIDPSNIMVTNDGKVKLIDFGIAKQMVGLNTLDRNLTSTGQFIGKAAYAAPELILGDIRNQNYSTDVYAIGILYFQLLTGSLPFSGSTFDIFDAQLHKQIPLNRIKSPQIKAIIKKATSKKQANRYFSAAQFRAAIDEISLQESRLNRKNIMVGGISMSVILLIGALCCWLAKPQEENTLKTNELYHKYLNNLNSQNPDSALCGLNGMTTLAEEDYLPAMYQIVSTYAWPRKDSLSLSRKKILSLPTDSLGLLIDNSKNEDAIAWMRKIIQNSDSTDYRVMSWLAHYYLYGKVVNKDINQAMRLINKSRVEAIKNNDEKFVEKIDKFLYTIEQKK